MRRGIASLLLLLALVLGACGPHASHIPGGRLGELRLFTPDVGARAVVFWLGASGSWSSADAAAVRRLTSAGAVVAVANLPPHLAAPEKEHGCLYLVGDVEAAVRLIERRAGLDHYLRPILAGIGESGQLAIAILRQAPPATLAGAVAIDPISNISAAHPICQRPPQNAGLSEEPSKKLIYVAFSKQAVIGGKARTTMASLSQLGLRVTQEPILSAPGAAQESLAELILRHMPMEREIVTAADDLSDLPLIELPARPKADLVVVISGDGGWRDIDRQIAETLHGRGYAVIGWDSLQYFWHAKNPETLGRDLARVLFAYQARWHASQVALVGYSFGADVLPFAYNRLPAGLRRLVVQISLLGYLGRADFEIRVAGWLGSSPSESAIDGAPEISRIDPRLVQCFYGVKEADSACPRLKDRGVEVIETGGGHHFGGDYPALVQRIADGIAARSLGGY